MSRREIIALVIVVASCLVAPALAGFWVSDAEGRLVELEAIESGQAPAVAVAREANEQYCTPELKQILRRVLLSCGLIGGSGGRGCQPLEARNVATMAGEDFNALFLPMQERGGIVQFEQASAELTPDSTRLIERSFADRRGASYFFVVARASPEGSEEAKSGSGTTRTVARASPEGSTESNRELSRQRAEAVMSHLSTTFEDPELERQVGLLWLGEEYAQLDPSFCEWSRSGEASRCAPEDLNRSAFIAWIDCRL